MSERLIIQNEKPLLIVLSNQYYTEVGYMDLNITSPGKVKTLISVFSHTWHQGEVSAMDPDSKLTSLF